MEGSGEKAGNGTEDGEIILFDEPVLDPALAMLVARILDHFRHKNHRRIGLDRDGMINHIKKVILAGHLETGDHPEVIFGDMCRRSGLFCVGSKKMAIDLVRHIGAYFTPQPEMAAT